MAGVLLGARLLLAVVFLVAGVAKLADRRGSRRVVREFGVPDRLVSLVGVLLPVCEVAVAGALIVSPTGRWGAVGALVLLGLFIAGMSVALRHGRRPDCHCFGQLSSSPVGRATLLRNVGLAGVAGFVLLEGWDGGGVSATAWVERLSPGALIGIGAGAGLVALQSWFSWQLLRQHGRLLLRIEQLEARGSQASELGLTPGVPAPEFSLATAAGERVSLTGLLGAGSPVLLVFSDPGCPACIELAPDIARWRTEYAGSLQLAVISHAIDELSPPDALLDHGRVVASAYELSGTPGAVMIGVDGGIASWLAIGRPAIAALVQQAGIARESRQLDWGVRSGDSPAGVGTRSGERSGRAGELGIDGVQVTVAERMS